MNYLCQRQRMFAEIEGIKLSPRDEFSTRLLVKLAQCGKVFNLITKPRNFIPFKKRNGNDKVTEWVIRYQQRIFNNIFFCKLQSKPWENSLNT